MKTIFRFLAIISVGTSIFLYQNGIPENLPFLGQTGQVIDSQNQGQDSGTKVLGDSAQVKEVSLSEPLKVGGKWLRPYGSMAIMLSSNGIIQYTNKERINGDLSPLGVSEKLNASAKTKLHDLLKNKYFEHTSPDGVTISDLAVQSGYDFILIGENLAIGDFRDDSAVVSAWMESPTHRANILNGRYTEIGVAVGRGVLNGKETWLIVQHFGRPADLCPEIDKKLKSIIDQNKAKIEALGEELNLGGGGAAAFLSYVKDFSKVKEYKKLAEETTTYIDLYNTQVSNFNNCLEQTQ